MISGARYISEEKSETDFGNGCVSAPGNSIFSSVTASHWRNTLGKQRLELQGRGFLPFSAAYLPHIESNKQ